MRGCRGAEFGVDVGAVPVSREQELDRGDGLAFCAGLDVVAEALAGAGRYEDAAVIARGITTPSDRARALASVAKVLAAAHQGGATARGRTFLADALNGPVWSPGIADAVLSVEPDCTAAFLTEIVTGRHERNYT
ncbi:hypothetical protein [Streptomyces sp. NBC_01590]|uniref:hypothetical protein n=1 Tax=Streptomyces sp. NBC_01590 TaxID=2975887 RepID=UPI002F911850